MEKFMLISVSEREIETSYHETHEDAYAQMVKELDETGDREDHTEGDDYELDESSAWSNMNHHCNCDWLIVELTFFAPSEPAESESGVLDQAISGLGNLITEARVDGLTQKQNELRRQIRDKKIELARVEAELKTASHKPARQITCEEMLDKITDINYSAPVVVYEGRVPKKITKVIVSENHVRLEISSNLQTEYQE